MDQATGQAVMSTLRFFEIVGPFGAFGGLLNGIITNQNKLIFPGLDRKKNEKADCSLNLGFLADMLVGAGGAVGVFMVLIGAITLGTGSKDYIIICSTALVAGFGGGSILRMMEQYLETRVGKEFERNKKEIVDEAKKDAEDIASKIDSDISHIKAAQASWSEARDARKDGLKSEGEGKDGEAKKKYIFALESINEALKNDPSSPSAHNMAALIYRRLGRCKEAIPHLDRAIELNSDYASAFYNRACYNTMLEKPFEVIKPDLEKALSLKPSLKDNAKSDKDFDLVKENPLFKKMLEEPC